MIGLGVGLGFTSIGWEMTQVLPTNLQISFDTQLKPFQSISCFQQYSSHQARFTPEYRHFGQQS